MAKKKAVEAEVPQPQAAKPEAKAPEKKLSLEERLSAAEARIAELEGDFIRLAQEIGHTFGEPLASRAKEIAEKRQGAPA